VQVARLLIEFDAITTAENKIGSTLLHDGSLLGDGDITRLLIENDPNSKVMDEHKFTLPWEVEASESGGVDLGSLPIEHGEESDEDDF
jgi:hypothetical protein